MLSQPSLLSCGEAGPSLQSIWGNHDHLEHEPKQPPKCDIPSPLALPNLSNIQLSQRCDTKLAQLGVRENSHTGSPVEKVFLLPSPLEHERPIFDPVLSKRSYSQAECGCSCVSYPTSSLHNLVQIWMFSVSCLRELLCLAS